MRFFSFCAGPLLFVLLAGFPLRRSGVEAGTAVRMELEEMARGADLIVEGRVLSASAEEQGGWIETEYLLRVDRTLAGTDERWRALRLPGGVLPDGRGMILAGMPRLSAGEDVLLFLGAESEHGIRMPVGLAQGKFSVLRRAGGGKVLVREPAGLTLVDARTGEARSEEGRTVLDYASVVARIQAARAALRNR